MLYTAPRSACASAAQAVQVVQSVCRLRAYSHVCSKERLRQKQSTAAECAPHPEDVAEELQMEQVALPGVLFDHNPAVLVDLALGFVLWPVCDLALARAVPATPPDVEVQAGFSCACRSQVMPEIEPAVDAAKGSEVRRGARGMLRMYTTSDLTRALCGVAQSSTTGRIASSIAQLHCATDLAHCSPHARSAVAHQACLHFVHVLIRCIILLQVWQHCMSCTILYVSKC